MKITHSQSHATGRPHGTPGARPVAVGGARSGAVPGAAELTQSQTPQRTHEHDTLARRG